MSPAQFENHSVLSFDIDKKLPIVAIAIKANFTSMNNVYLG